MAHDGELVKMSNGRWARFERCSVCERPERSSEDDSSILVAVELEDHYQELLHAAAESLESYRRQGIPVQVSLGQDGKGKVRLTFQSQAELS